MNIQLKDLNHSVGNNGVTFSVYDGKDYKGKLTVKKGGIEWFKGKRRSGTKIDWKKFISYCEGN